MLAAPGFPALPVLPACQLKRWQHCWQLWFFGLIRKVDSIHKGGRSITMADSTHYEPNRRNALMSTREYTLATLVALLLLGGVAHGQEKEKSPSLTQRFDRFRRNLFGGDDDTRVTQDPRGATQSPRSRAGAPPRDRITGVPDWPGQGTPSRVGPPRSNMARPAQPPRTGSGNSGFPSEMTMPGSSGELPLADQGGSMMPASGTPAGSSRRTAQPGYERQTPPMEAQPMAPPAQELTTQSSPQARMERPAAVASRPSEPQHVPASSMPAANELVPPARPVEMERVAAAPSATNPSNTNPTGAETVAAPATTETATSQPARTSRATRGNSLEERLASARRAGSSRLLSGAGTATSSSSTTESTEAGADEPAAIDESSTTEGEQPSSDATDTSSSDTENTAGETAPADEQSPTRETRPSRRATTNASPASETVQNRSRRGAGRSSPAASASVESTSDTNAGTTTSSAKRESTAAAASAAPSEADAEAAGPDVLVTRQSPAISVETVGPRKIKVDMPAAYRIVVKNSGAIAAEGLLVTVRVPEGAELVGSQAGVGSVRPAKSIDRGAGVEWLVDSLGAHSETSMTLRLVPKKSRPIELGVEWSLSPVAVNTMVEVQEPKLLMSLVGPEEVYFGKRDSYKLTLTNPGTGDAEHVVVRLLPTTPGDTQAVIHEVGTLRAGGSKVVELELTARQQGTLRLRAEATADGSLTAAVDEEVLVRRADLKVEVEGPQLLYAGTAGTYTVRVSNPGNAAAQNVKLAAILPAGATFVSGSDGATVAEDATRTEWSSATLRPGAEWVVTYRCELTAAGNATTQIVATADEELENSFSLTTEVEALADLSLEVKDPSGPVPVGQEAVYEIHIHNRGTKSAAGIGVVAFFSRGIEPMQIEGGKHHVGPGRITFAPLASIGAGQEIVLTIKAQAQQSGNHLFRAEVQCAELETKLSAEETTRFYGDGAAAKPRRGSAPAPGPEDADASNEDATGAAHESESAGEGDGSYWTAPDADTSGAGPVDESSADADTLVPEETSP